MPKNDLRSNHVAISDGENTRYATTKCPVNRDLTMAANHPLRPHHGRLRIRTRICGDANIRQHQKQELPFGSRNALREKYFPQRGPACPGPRVVCSCGAFVWHHAIRGIAGQSADDRRTDDVRNWQDMFSVSKESGGPETLRLRHREENYRVYQLRTVCGTTRFSQGLSPLPVRGATRPSVAVVGRW